MNPDATLRPLIDSLSIWGSRPALGLRGECGSYWFSYKDLFHVVHTVARNLASLHLRPGARLVIWSSNSPEWVACFLGAVLQGVVVVAADSTSDRATVANIIRQTGAVLVIYGPEQPGGADLSTPARPISEITQPGPASSGDFVASPVTANSEAVILFTSGSGGNARGVVLSHGNLMSQVARFRNWRRVIRLVPIRMLALSPLSHVQGLILGALLPLSLGFSTLYSQSVEPSQIVTSIRLSRIGILLAVPGVLELVERKLVREIAERFGWQVESAWRLPLMRAFRLILGPRFRAVFTGGATLPLHQELFWRRASTLLVQGYGATETSAIATVNWPFIGRAGSVGSASRNGAIRLAEDGEIQIRGPHVARGYAGLDNTSLEVTEDGYYRTGDLGRRDRKNRLFLIGRKNDLIVTAEGHNVSPTEIESALEECSGVRASVAAGIVRGGREEIHAVLLMQQDGDVGAAIRDANSRLPGGHRIQSWSIWPDSDLPRGALGKIRRVEVIRRVQDGLTLAPQQSPEAASLDDCLAEPDWRRRLDRLARYFVDSNDARGPRELADYLKYFGLDSMNVIQVAARMDELRGYELQGVPVNTAVEQVTGAGALPANTSIGLRPRKESPPKWQFWPGLTALRAVLRAITVDPVLFLRLRVTSAGLSNIANVNAPCILALYAQDRQHPSDYLAVYRALPGRLARRMVLVMRSNPPDGFAPYLHPGGSGGVLRRWALAALFHVGLPLVFPFSLFPASTTCSTMLGLAHAAAGIDRGYCPAVVWGPGTALLAVETRCNVIPIRLSGNEQFKGDGFRLRMQVQFGTPFEVPGQMDYQSVAAAVENRFTVMKP
jgi:long-chain acyl-CoA synthetase